VQISLPPLCGVRGTTTGTGLWTLTAGGSSYWKYALESTGFDPLVGSDGFDPLWCKSPNGSQML
jgi:hypothetical protein